MPLSEREQQLLDQMERALYEEDPRFVSSLRDPSSGARRTRWLVGGVGVLAGFGLVILGVNTEVWVGVLGFALMVAAAAYALTPPRRVLGTVQPDGSVRAAEPRPGRGKGARSARPGRKTGSSGTFMQRMEQRWERRQERDRGW